MSNGIAINEYIIYDKLFYESTTKVNSLPFYKNIRIHILKYLIPTQENFKLERAIKLIIQALNTKYIN